MIMWRSCLAGKTCSSNADRAVYWHGTCSNDHMKQLADLWRCSVLAERRPTAIRYDFDYVNYQ